MTLVQICKILRNKEGEKMKEFDDLAKKETCEIYSLKIPNDMQWRCQWAKIIIDSDLWLFSCLSDAGNFSYRWPVEDNRTFKKFLTEIDMGYLMRKIEPRATEFDFESTIKNIKEHLFESRMSDDIPKVEAREVYELLKHLDYDNSEDLVIYQLIEGHKYFSDDPCWTVDLTVKKHSPEAITFTEVVFPLFQDSLKAELGIGRR